MADVYPVPTDAGIVFPAQANADYVRDVGEIEKFPDSQGYTIEQIYRLVLVNLEDNGIPAERMPPARFLFFFRQILNDYSFRVGEFQRALRYTGGGGIFRIPSLRKIIFVGVNGYGTVNVSERTIIDYRHAERSLSSNTWFYSQNGNLLNLYPAIGDSDTITILASVLADAFNEDSIDTIMPQGDGYTLFEGVLWKCLEQHGKPFLHMKGNYERSCVERRSRVDHQIYPSQLRPPALL